MDTLFEFEDWVYQLIPLDEGCLFAEPSIQDFYKVWKGKVEAPYSIPFKKRFDFEDFLGLHGWISVEKILNDPFDLLPTLHGSHLRDVDGGDFTNIPISQHNKDKRLHQHDMLFIRLTEKAMEKECFYYCGGTSVQNNQVYFDEWYGFPALSNECNIQFYYSILRRKRK